jgi:ring-1,2-phenylacetyl-CoA epoxidase subunit PaaB
MRYEVFIQPAPGQPHQNAGSVHAGDAETALLAARNVYGRRPSAVDMWVTPECAIFTRTVEQLAAQPDMASPMLMDAEPVEYAVFNKPGSRRSMTFVSHLGSVMAASPRAAIARACERWPGGDVFVWWVCPVDQIAHSPDGASPSWFDPAKDKHYRQQGYYGSMGRTSRRERAVQKPA